MQVNSVGHNVNTARNVHKSNVHSTPQKSSNVAFTGGFKSPNAIVKLMDFIATGGFAAAFIIQDGIGFIAPRVGKGLLRGGKIKRDEDGNKILDKNGEPKRELNWAYARKEGLREIITGPSAIIIPYFLLKGIKNKFGRANNIKLDYIDGFKDAFSDYVKNNLEAVKSGKADRKSFYTAIFKDVLEKSVNAQLPEAERLTDIETRAKQMAQKQINVEKILADKSLTKEARNKKLAEIGSVVDDFMRIRKQKIGGDVSEMTASFSASEGKGVKHGSIGEIASALGDYFDDAVKTVGKKLKDSSETNVDEIMKHFTKHKMGSRFITNIGLFLAVALFYTQIPKLYNMGTNGKNPALANEEDEQPALQNNKTNSVASVEKKTDKSKDVSFGGKGAIIEKLGNRIFNGKKLKGISDIFELDGPIIQGNAMSVLLYSFCIPPRLINAQDKYDLGEILVRDFTAFTTLLFGAKALSRLFSDGFTKITGLALNKKDLAGKKWYQKVIDYLNPTDRGHAVLSSKQLESKYTHLEDYKNQVGGFMDFIEQSGGDVKKAFSQDKAVKEEVDKILKMKGKTFESATSKEIKNILNAVNKSEPKLLKGFYDLFKKENGLLNRAKTCNSAFGALSTLVLVPGLIIALTDICKNMTDKRKAKEKLAAAKANKLSFTSQVSFIPSNKPTMAGFLNKQR